MDAGRFQRPEARRLTLIRDLLDRVPDTHIEEEPVEFPPLGREPSEERYGVLKPLEELQASLARATTLAEQAQRAEAVGKR